MTLWGWRISSCFLFVLAATLTSTSSGGCARAEAAFIDASVGAESSSSEEASQEDEFSRWVGELDSSDPVEVMAAIRRMESIGIDAFPAKDQLIELLQGESVEISIAAAFALASFGSDANDVLPLLLEKAKEPKRRADAEPVAVAYSEALGSFGETAMPTLREALASDNETERYVALQAMHRVGPAAVDAMPQLRELIEGDDPKLQWAAIYVCEGIGAAAESEVDVLIPFLSEEDFQMQIIACRALAAIGPGASDALDELLEVVVSGNISSRSHAAMAIGAIGPTEDHSAERLLDLLLPMTEHFSDPLRQRSLIAIGSMGHHATAASDHLRRLMETDSYRNRVQAAVSYWLVTAEAEPAVSCLLSRLSDPTDQLPAIEGLGRLSTAAEAAVPPLVELLSAEDEDLIFQAISALVAIGPASAPALARLEELAQQENSYLREPAFRAWRMLRSSTGR